MPDRRFIRGGAARIGNAASFCTRKSALTLLLVVAGVLGAGCQAPRNGADIDTLTVPTRSDVVSVQVFWPNVIWLYNADQQPVGFQAPVYFVSGETQRGVFVDGGIQIWMYEVTPSTTNQSDRKVLYEWKLDGQGERNFRIRHRAIGGYYYGLRLKWPPEIDLQGKKVEIVIGYTRPDGTTIRSLGRRDEIVPSHRRRMLAPGGRSPESAPARRYEAPVRGSASDPNAVRREEPPVDRRPLLPATGAGSAQTTETRDAQGRPTVIIRTNLR